MDVCYSPPAWHLSTCVYLRRLVVPKLVSGTERAARKSYTLIKMSKSKSSPSSSSPPPPAPSVAVRAPAAAGQQQAPRLYHGAPVAAASSAPETTTAAAAKRRLTKRGALAVALCVTAATYLSVLVSNGSRALSTTHHQRAAGAGSPAVSWERRRGDAAVAGIAARAEGRLRASGSQAVRATGTADGAGVAGSGGAVAPPPAAGRVHWPAALPNTGRSEGARSACVSCLG